LLAAPAARPTTNKPRTMTVTNPTVDNQTPDNPDNPDTPDTPDTPDSPDSALRRSPAATWLGRVLAAALVVGGIVCLVMVGQLGMLPTSWLVIACIAAALVGGAVALGLWLTKAPPAWVRFSALAIVALVGIAGEAAVVKAAGDFNRFFEEAAPLAPTAEYVVIALADHDPAPASLTGEVIGELADSVNREAIEAHLADKFQTTFATCGDATGLATELTSGRFDAAALNAGIYAAYEEADPEFYASVQVIYSFDIDDAVPPPPSPTPVAQGEPFVVYISGIDTAGQISRVSRSDVNILMVVNPNTGQILLVNTPRDYYVQLHDTTGTKDKLTHAGIYGVQKSIDTLQDLYGISIDYYARVNFSSVIEMVDLVGGIDLVNPESFKSIHGGGMTFEAGELHLNGEQALAFSRERYAFAAGDRTRGKNQQLVIAALVNKASERSNLLRYNELLTALADAVEFNIPQEQIANLVKQRLEDGQSWQVTSYSVDGTGASEPTYSMGSLRLYVMIPDQATVDEAHRLIEATLAG
jgi:LCP family protein required for cell wall assembly